jgi:ABC-type oligopeptide transport system ATPase subunit
MSEALLELRHVSRAFGSGSNLFDQRQVVALKDFSLSIDANRPTITAIVGESGSGKTTMARLALGLDSPSTGEVLYEGKDLRKLSGREWREYRRGVQAILQDPFGVYNSFYKVDHVLTTPLRKFRLAQSPKQARAMIEQALVAVGLVPDDTLGRYPHQLSGGQRQRIMVARTLLLRPRVIVADEPVSMIDASLRATVLGNLLQLKTEFGISLIYITHDLTTAYQISDLIMVLYRGEVVEAGSSEEVIRQPKHAYTRLLIESIPEADPDRAWGDGQDLPGLEDDDEEVSQALIDRYPLLEAATTVRGNSSSGDNGGRREHG